MPMKKSDFKIFNFKKLETFEIEVFTINEFVIFLKFTLRADRRIAAR